MAKIIYIVLLEQSKHFLFSRKVDNKSDVHILLEAEIKYDFLKKYKPIRIFDRINEFSIFDLDKYVKQYMLSFGIQNVRGGTYSQEKLLDYHEKTIQDELASIVPKDEMDEAVQNLITTYADKPFSKKEVVKEIEQMNTRFSKYQEELAFLKKIKINVEQMKDNMKWLENTCKAQVDAYKNNKKNTFLYRAQMKEDIEKYKSILKDMKKIYDIFTIDLDTRNQYTESPIFKYPQFVFDDFFYHWHRIHLDSSVNDAIMVCSYYIMFIVKIENRMDEYTFDVDSWEKGIEWKTPRAIHLLQKINNY
jgi:hypothetical protein